MVRAKKSQETRDKLLDAAEDVFNEKGVSHTTLNDIAAAAGVTRGAIYWHFKNKFDVFKAMCDRVNEQMTAMIDAIAHGKSDDPIGDLYKSAVFVFQQVEENEHYRKVLNILFHKCEYIDASSDLIKRQQEWRTERFNALHNVMRQAQLKKQLPEDLDIPLACMLLHSTFFGLISTWLFTPHCFDLQSDALRIIRMVLDALSQNMQLRLPSQPIIAVGT